MDNNNPYAPPKASLTDAPRVVASEYEFRDLGRLTTTVTVLLGVGVVLDMLRLGSSFMQMSLLGASFTHEQARANDLREALANGAWSLLFLITTIVFARWIYLAHRNLPSLGAENLRVRPGWAVGMFFIPILNLWKPCQAMSDLVRASRDPRYWHLDDMPALVVCWWILWLIVTTANNFAAREAWGPNSIDALRSATVAQILTSVLSIPLYILALLIVRRVWRDQARVVGVQP